MSTFDRLSAFQQEKAFLDLTVRVFAKQIAKFKKQNLPGNYYRGYQFFPKGRHEEWNETVVIDHRPHIATYWEYADCGADPYWFPVEWLDMSEEDWQKEITAEQEAIQKERDRLEEERKAQALKSKEERDKREYRRLKKKYG